MFGKIKEKVADYLVKDMERFEDYLKYELNCKHCVYYNLIVDTGDVVVDECLKGIGIPNHSNYVACYHFKLKKEKKTNIFGVDMV